MELVFMRGVFQGCFVLLALVYFRDPHTGQRLIWCPYGSNAQVRWLVLARGIIGGCGFLCFYFTISSLPLGDATTLLSLNPILTVVAAPIFLDEASRISHVVAAIASLVGCMLIAKPSFLFGNTSSDELHSSHPSTYNPMGYITALLGASCAATVYILIRRAGKVGVHTVQLLFSWVTFGVLFSFLLGVVRPMMIAFREARRQQRQQGPVLYEDHGTTSISFFVWPEDSSTWAYVLGACTFGSIGHVLLNYAARHAPAGLSSIMRASGIVWSYLLELIIFHQVPYRITLLGVCLILFSLATIAIEKYQESMDTTGATHQISCTSDEKERTRLTDTSTYASKDTGSGLEAGYGAYGSLEKVND